MIGTRPGSNLPGQMMGQRAPPSMMTAESNNPYLNNNGRGFMQMQRPDHPSDPFQQYRMQQAPVGFQRHGPASSATGFGGLVGGGSLTGLTGQGSGLPSGLMLGGITGAGNHGNQMQPGAFDLGVTPRPEYRNAMAPQQSQQRPMYSQSGFPRGGYQDSTRQVPPNMLQQLNRPSHDLLQSLPRSSLEGLLAAPKPPPEREPIKKPAGLYRITRNQSGSISIYVSGKNGADILLDIDELQLKPGTFMDIKWELPRSVYSDRAHEDLSLGLVRYGAGSNFPCIVAKSLAKNSRSTVKTADMFGNEVVQGRVQFHAPKSAGVFVYRIFDNSSKERAMVTYGTSISFIVELADVDVTMNLKHALDSFEVKAYARGLTQLNSTVKGMRTPGKPLQGDHPQVVLQRCMYAMFDILEEGVKILKQSKVREKKEVREKGDSLLGQVEERAINREEEEFWSAVRLASRLQVEVHETIEAVKLNRIAWTTLTESQKVYCEESLKRYSVFLHRHFASPDDMAAGVLAELGFTPAPLVFTVPEVMREFRGIVFPAVAGAISELLPTYMPGPEFDNSREAIRARIERTLNNCGILPDGTTVVLYGSSKNNFGSNSADLDMCLMLPLGRDVPTDDKPQVIEAIGDALRSIGMTDVRPRSTARIPIVQFIDPQSGLECDISFNNPLALCNTRLLRTYSEVDPRVRPLVYIIKNWAKTRQINSPGDGTLSSYGYIMCLLHFLQTRPIPVVPNLQRLPPDWAGESHSPSAPCLHHSHDIELNPVDSSPCKTYFYSPTPETIGLLTKYGDANKDSIVELLAAFFAYYAHEFNFRHAVVSVQAGQAISKISKVSTSLTMLNVFLTHSFSIHFHPSILFT